MDLGKNKFQMIICKQTTYNINKTQTQTKQKNRFIVRLNFAQQVQVVSQIFTRAQTTNVSV